MAAYMLASSGTYCRMPARCVGAGVRQLTSHGCCCMACSVLLCTCAGDKKAAAPFPDGSGTHAHDPYWATVTESRELHMPASDRSCVHVELDISGNRQLSYQTGVSVCVQSVLLEMQGAVFHFVHASGPLLCVGSYVEQRYSPRRHMLQLCSSRNRLQPT